MLKRDLYYESIPTKSLRDDVRYLGNILGRVIKKQEGENFFNLVEKIRLLSKANTRNKNNKNRFNKITSEIQRLKPIKIFKLAPAIESVISETIPVSDIPFANASPPPKRIRIPQAKFFVSFQFNINWGFENLEGIAKREIAQPTLIIVSDNLNPGINLFFLLIFWYLE